MPSKEVILSYAKNLKGHCWAQEEDPKGDEVYSGEEYGATFKLSKPEGTTLFDNQKDASHLFLILKGKVEGKKKLEKDFVTALGEPLSNWPARRFRSQMIFWDTTKALNGQSDQKGRVFYDSPEGLRLEK